MDLSHLNLLTKYALDLESQDSHVNVSQKNVDPTHNSKTVCRNKMNRYYVSNESTADQLKYVVKDVETKEVVCECERLTNSEAIASALSLFANPDCAPVIELMNRLVSQNETDE